MITQLSQLDLNGEYSYADYLTWQFNERVELIKGKIMAMSPAPTVKHQNISGNLYAQLRPFFRKRCCQVFYAPFDVRLYDRKKSLLQNQDVITVVQPDLCVICDTALLDKRGCNGAPDLIVEILSKGNFKHDLRTKFALYQEAGVNEYWVVRPYEKSIEQFVLNAEGKYQTQAIYVDDDYLQCHLFPDLQIDLTDVFMD